MSNRTQIFNKKSFNILNHKWDDKEVEPRKKTRVVVHTHARTSQSYKETKVDRQKFTFSKGDMVMIFDYSYHREKKTGNRIWNSDLITRNPAEVVGFTRIWLNEAIFGKVTLDVVIKLSDGRIVYSAANMLRKI